MTSYEMVCAALAHFETMTSQCVTTDGCAYRAPSGERCLIGALIPDSLYDPTFENKDAGLIATEYLPQLLPSDMSRHDDDRYAIPGDGFKADGIAFLNVLQSCHDGAMNCITTDEFQEDVRESIRRRCLTWGMDFPSQEEIDAHRGMTI